MQLRGNLHKRLEDIGKETGRLRESLRVLDEQVAYVRELADEATTKALVSSTPLADRERRDALEELRRARRQREEVAERLRTLESEQDTLLERLLPQAGTT